VTTARVLVLRDLLAIVAKHALAETVDLVYVVAVLGIAVDEALAEDLVALAPPVPSECREKSW